MKREAVLSLSIAALTFSFFLSKDLQARTLDDSPDTRSTASTDGHTVAMRMVCAEAVLTQTLDARKAQPGQEFSATLSDKVQLKNGPELPKGTVLIGTVATDNMQKSGTSSLALRFTRAKLKDGKEIPIKATIVSIYDAGTSESLGANPWTADMVQIDQEGTLLGVELHSRVAAENSGVFVSKKKADVKLPKGYGIALAIASGS